MADPVIWTGSRRLDNQAGKTVYNRIAPVYDVLDLPFEYRRYKPIRQRLFRVLDAGTGRNIVFYPESTEVTGIDFSKAMLARAKKRRERAEFLAAYGLPVCEDYIPKLTASSGR